MKIPVWVETEVEVEINAKHIVAALNDLPEPDRKDSLCSGLNSFANFLNKVSDELIMTLAIEQRRVIGEFFEQQAKRWMKGEKEN